MQLKCISYNLKTNVFATFVIQFVNKLINKYTIKIILVNKIIW